VTTIARSNCYRLSCDALLSAVRLGSKFRLTLGSGMHGRRRVGFRSSSTLGLGRGKLIAKVMRRHPLGSDVG
jgi:hypothetical protein